MTKTFEQLNNIVSTRFENIKRDYSIEDVKKLSGSIKIDHTLAHRGSVKLWSLLHSEDYVNTLGAMTGNQAIQQVRAGLKAIYLSGWQIAADDNLSGGMYPDQSIYSANSGPELVKKINRTLLRADEIEFLENGSAERDWFAPIIADAKAGFGGVLNAFEITRNYIEAGASGVHFEDQLAEEKKYGHMGDKVLIPIKQHIENLNAARLAADIAGTPTLIIARTDAESAELITSDVDDRDKPYLTGERTAEGFYTLTPESSFDRCVTRGKAYAEYADLVWMETSTPNLDKAKRFSEEIRKENPNQLLAYNCSSNFNWTANLSKEDIARFQKELGAMGYKFQLITLAGFHTLNYSMFELAHGYKNKGMTAYSELQDSEFLAEHKGYTAHKHQREVGSGWFDTISFTVKGGASSTTALSGSTEEHQFNDEKVWDAAE